MPELEEVVRLGKQEDENGAEKDQKGHKDANKDRPVRKIRLAKTLLKVGKVGKATW